MPKTVKSTSILQVDLSKTFSSNVGSYSYAASSNLKLWLQFGATLTDSSSSSDEIDTIDYMSDAVANNLAALISVEALDSSSAAYPTYSVLQTKKNPVKKWGKVIYTAAPTPVTFGSSETADVPFSVSVIAKINPDIGSTTVPGIIFGFGDATGFDYKLSLEGYSASSYIRFYLRKNSTGANISIRFPVDYDDYKVWRNYTLTYDGSATTGGMKIYIDGVEQVVSEHPDASYTGMRSTSENLFVGSSNTNTTHFDGFITELSMFDKELTQTEVSAIYEASFRGSAEISTAYFSGELSLPARALSLEADSQVTQYFDGGTKKAEYTEIFNDSDTILFTSRELPASIGVESGTTSTPRLVKDDQDNPAINITHSFDSSFVSRQLRNTFEGTTDAFNEHEKFLTLPEERAKRPKSIDIYDLKGFEEDLDRQSVIELNLRPSEETTFGVTGSVNADENLVNPMVYWNNALKRWETIGTGTYYSTNTPADFKTKILDNASIGFAPTEGFYIPADKSNFKSAFRNFGLPVDNFGFPKSEKFHATGSQCIKLSDYISEPFIVQRMEYELDATLYADKATGLGYIEKTATSGSYIDKTDFVGSYFTFFALIQNNSDSFNHEFKTTIATQSSETADSLTSYSITSSFDPEIKSSRDLVNYMQVAIYSDGDENDLSRYGYFNEASSPTLIDSHDGFLAEGFKRELNISGSDFIDSGLPFDQTKYSHSGSLVLTGTVKEEISHESYGMNFYVNASQYCIADLGNARDNSNIQEKLKPRSFNIGTKSRNEDKNDSFNCSLILNSSKTRLQGVNSFKRRYSNHGKESPFILLPADNLVLGWQSPVPTNPYSLEAQNASSQMTIGKRYGKLKLYGSFVRNSEKYHIGDAGYSNNGVSKTISNNVSDSFHVSSRSTMSGSYVDRSFAGDIPNRQMTSRSNETSALTNSSISFSKSSDKGEIISDSNMTKSNPDAYFKVSSFGNISDMIEQRKLYAYLDKGTVIYTVTRRSGSNGALVDV